ALRGLHRLRGCVLRAPVHRPERALLRDRPRGLRVAFAAAPPETKEPIFLLFGLGHLQPSIVQRALWRLANVAARSSERTGPPSAMTAPSALGSASNVPVRTTSHPTRPTGSPR